MSKKSYIVVTGKTQNQLLHKYIEDGVRKQELVNFQPVRGYECAEETEWKTVYGKNLYVRRFDNMEQCKEWTADNNGIFRIYGDIKNEIGFITETYSGDVPVQKSMMNIYNLDIEVYCGTTGFPKATNPENYINAITLQNMVTNQYYVFSLKDYTPTKPNVHYEKCTDESNLLVQLIDFFNRNDIDIITGWNIEFFDIPYIHDRMCMLLGENEFKKLSPVRKVRKNTKTVNNKELVTWDIQGIINWDYYLLYDKFTFDNKESYTLDFISNYELGQEKTKFKEEFGDLNTLYNDNFEKFIEYNIRDVELVYLLDQKLKFIDIALAYTYMMKCDAENIFGTLYPWDAFLYNELYHKHILCNPKRGASAMEFMGGYVREPDKGMHDWITVYDIVSSYPNQIISSNMSPETVISRQIVDEDEELQGILEKFHSIEKCIEVDKMAEITPILQKKNMTYTSNGQFFSTVKQGFIPEVVQRVFKERVAVKGLIKAAKEKGDRAEIEYLESRSQVLKIALNSLYGAISAPYFRWFDIRIATAVTYQGQLCARGAGTYLNENLELPWKYSDTDSLFFSLKEIVEQRFGDQQPDKETIVKFLLKYQDKILQPCIDEFFDKLAANMNQHQATIKMEHECIADVAIFVEKKKYVMHQLYKEGEWFIDKPKLKVKGIEIVRSSTPQVVRDKLKTAVAMIFDTMDNDALITFIEGFKKEFYQMSFEQISSPRGVKFGTIDSKTNEYREYSLESKGLPIQVRAAFIYNQCLEKWKLDKYVPIGDGSKIRFCYIKKPNKVGSDVIACIDKMPPEIKSQFQIDYPTQWAKTFVAPLTKIFECIGWNFSKTNSLEAFF